ncbi:lysozyme [Qipengyuania qiaonensis]|uniref:Lysozyme n=1 Tax=Qipengyuania qiaonensis TaxID=2867240 RepID=A0ABS7JE52_9SPHN|nr:lysozyme [Qipengyuania qiaonensis]MBX7483267.1 lysozyme [Qipengyuania qiaonensis]
MYRKPLFDAVRKLLGRTFSQPEVEALDTAIETMGDLPRIDDCGTLSHSIGPQGIRLIREFEGCARLRPDGLVEAYPDPGTGGSPWTIGWGATGPGIGKGTVWTQQQCDARLALDIERHARDVAEALDGAPTDQAQFDALVSFHYNTGAIGHSTLLKRHLSGDYDAAAKEFGRWNRAAGRVLQGLVRRRAAEAALYRSR